MKLNLAKANALVHVMVCRKRSVFQGCPFVYRKNGGHNNGDRHNGHSSIDTQLFEGHTASLWYDLALSGLEKAGFGAEQERAQLWRDNLRRRFKTWTF